MRVMGLFFFMILIAEGFVFGANDMASWIRDLKGENSGHTAVNFLTLPTSAGELSVGSASSCGMMDATDACFFSANTALFNRKKFAATHVEWLLGLRKEFLAACFPVEDVGTWGFFSQVFTPGTFDNAYTIDETPSHPSMVDVAAGVSFARSFLHKGLCVGVAVSYVESRIDNAAGRTACANVDVALTPSPFFFAHLRAGNFGPNLSYTVNVPEPLPVQAGLSLSIKPLAIEEELIPIIDPLIGLGMRKIADEPLIAGLSAQAALFKCITLRTGYEYSMDANRPTTTGLSAGVGLDRNNFGADFGWKDLSKELGSVWSLSVRAQLKEIAVKTAEDYYAIAQRYYGQQRYRQSLNNAKKAAALDPNMWKAHVLISTINALQRRKSGTEMAIIYTGNTGGQFAAVTPAEGSTLGGFARQAAAITRLREQFPLSAVIDAGNFLAPASLPVKARLADWYFMQCNYDAVALGKGELDFGLDRMFTKNDPVKTEYCCTNAIGLPGGRVVRTKTVSVKGYSLYIMAVVGHAQPLRPQDRALLTTPLGEITELLSKNAAKNATLRILIVSDTWERISALARGLPEIDIILCGGLRQKFETPMKIGNALALSPGSGGSCVGALTLRFDGRKKLESTNNHLTTLTEDVPSDPIVAAKVRLALKIEGAPGQDMVEPSMVKKPSAGVFAFLSNRDGAPGIYLKMLDQQAEIPLAHGGSECMKPVISFPLGKCAYFEKTSDSVCPALRVMDLTGAEKRTLPLGGCASEAHFSQSGPWLYYSGRTDSSSEGIFRIKPVGGAAQPVIDWKKSSEKYFDLSPDGASMVFGSNGNGTWQLFITDSLGLRPICFTDGGDNISPHFSPSGASCAFLSNKTSFKGSYDLWNFGLASGKAEQITVNAKVNDFRWLPDNKTIVCSAGEPTAVLKIINLDSNNCTRLIGGDSLMAYSERTPRLIMHKNVWKILYTREYNDGARKIFWVNIDGGGDQRVVNSKGQDWLE